MHSNHRTRRACQVALAVLALAMAGSARADHNPGYDRPGLGFTPAVLQAGDVTWEQGLPDFGNSDGVTLYTADSLLRVGLGGPFELQLGSSWNHLAGTPHDASGRGGSSVGLKFALPATGNFSWGVLGSATFTDGDRTFRSAHRQYLVGAAFNWQLDASDALGAYLENISSDGNSDQLVAVNAGRNLTDTVAGYVEVGWRHTDHLGNGTVAGAGVTWMVTPRVQLDASFRHRLGGEVDQWEGGVGVAIYFGHVL